MLAVEAIVFALMMFYFDLAIILSSRRPITALVRCVFTDPDFVPFEPPERPLGLLGLRTKKRDNLSRCQAAPVTSDAAAQ
jgi:hypothetical protein